MGKHGVASGLAYTLACLCPWHTLDPASPNTIYPLSLSLLVKRPFRMRAHLNALPFFRKLLFMCVCMSVC